MQASTTRGMSFLPDVAKRERDAQRRALETQVEQAYRAHLVGQERYRRATMNGKDSRAIRQGR
jgi:hypothetical protein